MAKRILVPLDDSESSEKIIPLAAGLASGTGSSVRLLRVAPVPELVMGPHGRVVAYTDQEMDRLTAEGLRDLSRSEAQFVGVPVESRVRFGDPVEEILLESEAFGADLIALVTSNRNRLRSVLLPDVAERVMREAPVPTLVLRV
jgi:nucleotide-binding universal stress UspA family protein